MEMNALFLAINHISQGIISPSLRDALQGFKDTKKYLLVVNLLAIIASKLDIDPRYVLSLQPDHILPHVQLLLAEALLPHKEQSPSDILSPAAFPRLQHQANLPCCYFTILALSQWKARQQAGVTSSTPKAGSGSPGPPAPGTQSQALAFPHTRSQVCFQLC